MSKWGVAIVASVTLITAIAVWIFATALQTNTGVTTASKTADRQDIADKLKTMGIVGTVLARQEEVSIARPVLVNDYQHGQYVITRKGKTVNPNSLASLKPCT